MRNLLKTLTMAAGTVVALAGTSFAATCNISDLQYSTQCIGRLEIVGPPNGSADAGDLNGTNGLLDGGGWSELAKIEDGSSSLLFSMTLGSTSGTYTIKSPLAGYDYALALKGGSGKGTNFFAAYLLPASVITDNLSGSDLTGAFSMAAFLGLTNEGSTPGLSNAVLFNRESASPIPLPAAGWLLIVGIGGLAAIKRRKKANA